MYNDLSIQIWMTISDSTIVQNIFKVIQIEKVETHTFVNFDFILKMSKKMH